MNLIGERRCGSMDLSLHIHRCLIPSRLSIDGGKGWSPQVNPRVNTRPTAEFLLLDGRLGSPKLRLSGKLKLQRLVKEMLQLLVNGKCRIKHWRPFR